MKRLLVISFIAVIAILTVRSIGQLGEEEILLSMTEPTNGSYFTIGESPQIMVLLPYQFTPDDYSQLRLYIYGPQDPTKTKTAIKLLNASADRSVKTHHYIDLLKDPNVSINGNILTYNLQPITDEEPGTYTASLSAVMQDKTIQSFPLLDFQIGIDVIETQVVEREKCADCQGCR